MHIRWNWFCLLLLFLAPTPLFAQGLWERVPVPTQKVLNSVFFTDSLYGWIAGDSGTIIHTSDGGKTWILQNTATTNDIVTLFFLDRNLGWASSLNYTTAPYGTVLLKTTDGGDHWIPSTYPVSDIFITCILYRDTMNGWMGGRPHALVRTTDGGVTWTQANVDTTVLAFFPVLGIRFYNDKYGYACGGMFDIAGVIWRTDNGGDLWHAIDPSEAPADEVHELHLFDSLHVMGAGGDPDFGYGVGMIRTSDGGLSWNYQELGVQGTAYDLDFRTPGEAWAPVGPARKLIFSTDTGYNWTAVPTPDSTSIYRMTFPDSLHGWAVGHKGAVIRYTKEVSGIHDPLTLGDGGFILFQNYPNPFSNETKIRFKVPVTPAGKAVSLRIKVFTITGTQVSEVGGEEFFPGVNELVLDASALPPGIYFYALYAGTSGNPTLQTRPGKMILIR
jgi:photosystem II stability/assembly factor-like uncharacterized protein